jgi:malonyl-CoA O-methyltransferase
LAKIEQVIGLDIALPMLQTTRQKVESQNLLLLCADAERLPLAEHAVNHIVSNLALQWCEDLTAVFSDFKRVLKPDGQLLFSTFGDLTLEELKQCWAKVDDYSHVNHFYSASKIAFFLQKAGFKDIEISEEIYLSRYVSVLALMQELKAIGAHNVAKSRRKTMTGKTKMLAMIAEYEKLRLVGGEIPATFEIITVTARV